MKIGLFDPSVEDHQGTPSSNLGDLIIQEAVSRELEAVFGQGPAVRVTTQMAPRRAQLRALSGCTHIFVGGTNLLSSHVRKYRQWKIGFFQARRIHRAILLGVGWWQYQEDPDWWSRFLWRRTLSHEHAHSVRDEYTREKLLDLGFDNVLNTGCPTMWPLATFDFSRYPCDKAEDVLLMLTDYARKPELDRALIQLLKKNYRRIYYWPQGRKDLQYLQGLPEDLRLSLDVLDHSLPALDRLLHFGQTLDYVGTRLHGGVRCMLHHKRALVLQVDNRAAEIARDTGLPVVARDDLDAIQRWIHHSPRPTIRLNTQAIQQWRAQFSTTATSCVPSGRAARS